MNPAQLNNIYLTGMMGVGKTTVGPILARQMGWKFEDTDFWIEARARMTISNLFIERGEEFFRKLEAEVIEQVTQSQFQVVALGGGALQRESNCQKILKSGILVYLQASEEVLTQRLLKEKGGRPLLAAVSETETLVRIQSLLRERKSSYEQAQIKLNTDCLAPIEVAEAIKKLVMTQI
jgi:shikimate kinase